MNFRLKTPMTVGALKIFKEFKGRARRENYAVICLLCQPWANATRAVLQTETCMGRLCERTREKRRFQKQTVWKFGTLSIAFIYNAFASSSLHVPRLAGLISFGAWSLWRMTPTEKLKAPSSKSFRTEPRVFFKGLELDSEGLLNKLRDPNNIWNCMLNVFCSGSNYLRGTI